MAKPRHVEFPDTGEFGQWSDRMTIMARDARLKGGLADLGAATGSVKRVLNDLEHYSEGPYALKIKTASQVLRHWNEMELTLGEFILEAEDRWASILLDPKHPAHADATSALEALSGMHDRLRQYAMYIEEMCGRLDSVYKLGKILLQNNKNKKAR